MASVQIRGYLSRWEQLTPCVRRFQHCVACSPPVLQRLQTEGWNFVRYQTSVKPQSLHTCR